MNVQSTRKTAEEIVAAIEALDLEPIKFKLMDADEGQGWSREYVEQMAVAYKRFLTLLVTHPETAIAPSKDIDKFWHGHILDTMKYAEDCEKVFGYFLHHFPYFGMRGEQDAATLAQAGDAMQRLYEQEFGETMPQQAAYCAASKPAYCAASTQAAYCAASKPSYCAAAVKAAYCAASTKAAYCAASKPSYCAGAVKAAYCAASKPSYCAATVEAAYCAASRQANDAAYCAVASKRLDLSTRPTLAVAA